MNIKNPLQSQLPELVDKKENITRIENNVISKVENALKWKRKAGKR